jgi:hypothetical protein
MLDRNWTKTQNGLAANISPYSWTEPRHGLRLNVTLLATGQTCFPHTVKPFQDCTEEDAALLLGAVKIGKCSCGNPRFESPLAQNRGLECETCFTNRIKAMKKNNPEEPSETEKCI